MVACSLVSEQTDNTCIYLTCIFCIQKVKTHGLGGKADAIVNLSGPIGRVDPASELHGNIHVDADGTAYDIMLTSSGGDGIEKFYILQVRLYATYSYLLAGLV
jgi:hypothetical protein